MEPLRGQPGLAVLDGGSLFLASVSPSDGGDYECQATNEAGSASRRVKLVVYGEQGTPELGSWGTPPDGTPGCPGPESSTAEATGCAVPGGGGRGEGGGLRVLLGEQQDAEDPLSPKRPHGDRARGKPGTPSMALKWPSR